MGKIFNYIFGKSKTFNEQKHNMLDLYVPYFSGKYDPELNSTFMSCVQAHARHASKALPKVLYKGELAKDKRFLNYLLSVRPNPLMDAPTFYETLATNYFIENNAFIYLEWDFDNFKEPLKHLWILNPDKNSMDVSVGIDKKLYLKFRLDGEEKITGFNNIIHIARNVNASELFGQGNKSIDTVLKVMQTNYEGVEQAIKSSAFIRFLLKGSTVLSPKAKQERAEYFASTYLGKDSSGVAYVDNAEEIIPVSSTPKYANADEMKVFKQEIYHYLGTNEKILDALFNDDEWQAYYESSLEPFLLKLETNLVDKLLTKEDIEKEYEIKIDADRLHSASLNTRVKVAAMIQKLPTYIPNYINELLFMPKTKNGEKEYSTLNYVESDKQNEYQDVSTDNDENEEEK